MASWTTTRLDRKNKVPDADAARVDVIRCDACGTRNRVAAGASGIARCGKCHVALPWITDAGDHDFDQIARGSSMPVLVDLWAEWCGPCRMVSPALEQLAHEMAGRLRLVKVNIEKAPELARRFDVQAVPTLLLLEHGDVVSRQIGAAPPHVLKDWVERTLSGSRS